MFIRRKMDEKAMKLSIAAAALLLVVASMSSALAQNARTIRKQAEASMVVTGQVDIGADGIVTGYSLDHRARLPDYVVNLVERTVPTWRFEQVELEGRPVASRVRMSLRLLAKPTEDGDYEVSIANGSFGEYSDNDTDHVTRGNLKPPRYPPSMADRGIEGTAYLLIKVGRDGAVEDVVAERVNLLMYGDQREMDRIRKIFAERSLNAARDWTFVPPSTGQYVDEPFWTVRVPVDYRFRDGIAAQPGQWEMYIPGPRTAAEWLKQDNEDQSDAMFAGDVQMVGNERRLLTPLHGG